MGFNKRYVDKKIVETYLNENKNLDVLFKADAFIFLDEISSKVYRWYCENNSIDEIKNKLSEYDKQTTI